MQASHSIVLSLCKLTSVTAAMHCLSSVNCFCTDLLSVIWCCCVKSSYQYAVLCCQYTDVNLIAYIDAGSEENMGFIPIYKTIIV